MPVFFFSAVETEGSVGHLGDTCGRRVLKEDDQFLAEMMLYPYCFELFRPLLLPVYRAEICKLNANFADMHRGALPVTGKARNDR